MKFRITNLHETDENVTCTFRLQVNEQAEVIEDSFTAPKRLSLDEYVDGLKSAILERHNVSPLAAQLRRAIDGRTQFDIQPPGEGDEEAPESVQ